MPSKFQTIIRAAMTAATAGTLVEAADTYKYVRKGIAEGNNVIMAAFVRTGAVAGNVIGAIGTTAIEGIALFDRYMTGTDVPSMSIDAGLQVVVAVNGVVSIPTTVAAVVGQLVAVNNTTGAVEFYAAGATPTTGSTASGWEVVQGCEANGLCFVKR